MKPIPSLLCIAFGCFALSCGPSSRQQSAPETGDARIIATVEGRPITVGDLQAEVKRRAPGRSLAALAPKERDALLEQLVRNQSVYAQAVKEGFDQTPAIRQRVQDLIVSRYLEQEEHTIAAEVSESDLEKYYEKNREQFAIPARVRFAVIKIGLSPKATDAKRDEAHQRAELIVAQARQGDDQAFDALVRSNSEDQATRYRGGDAGWVSRESPDRWSAEVIAAAFALEQPGELSPVIATRDALYLVRLLGRKPATCHPLSEVRAAIAYQLSLINRDRAEAQFFQQLQSNQKIEINRSLLDSLPAPVQQTEIKPPGVPAG